MEQSSADELTGCQTCRMMESGVPWRNNSEALSYPCVEPPPWLGVRQRYRHSDVVYRNEPLQDQVFMAVHVQFPHSDYCKHVCK